MSPGFVDTKPTLRPLTVTRDPILEYQFVFSMGIEPVALVTEINGLALEREVMEHKIVTPVFTPYTLRLPGRPTPGRITLKKALTADWQLWLWYDAVDDFGMTAVMTKVFCSITMYDRAYDPVMQWHLFNVWPAKLTGPNFKTDSNSFAFEELELVYEAITRIPV